MQLAKINELIKGKASNDLITQASLYLNPTPIRFLTIMTQYDLEVTNWLFCWHDPQVILKVVKL